MTTSTYIPPTVVATSIERIDTHTLDGPKYVRRRTYSDGGADHLHLTGPDDVSHVHLGYVPACGWCWLGAGHTHDAHHAALTGPVVDTAERAATNVLAER